ncbi:Transketolase central region [Candidatus Promineifilum breve]|uniref:1-deoxy-D-xylulose-5-phosphate synthase n=1 Tax=Candidatus Promineifilum breve TaxID=1806508 RepID=A0A160T7Y8_9CHLR|nr:transketolase C-terminal domain-containing protein [Candidatus Promineifilum breve]CUS05235.2 Transketolase central region [Candidatus Promineifilum breve]
MKNYEQTLLELMAADERIVVMTAENRAAIRNLPNLAPERFIDTGITEMTMVGAAAGLALRGRVPVLHALATFLTLRAFEFVRTDVGIGNLPVKLVGGVPGFLSDGNGPTHQAIEDVALMRGIPHMHVFCPADEEDMLLGLPHIINSPHPTYIRYNGLKPMVAHDPHFEIGRAEVRRTSESASHLRERDDVAILVYGMLFAQAWEAKALLEAEGLAVRLINVRTPKPIDEEAVLSAARECNLLVTLEDHFLTGGLYSIVAETLLRHGQTADVLPFALDERWFRPALLADVLRFEGFTADQIAARILEYLPVRA